MISQSLSYMIYNLPTLFNYAQAIPEAQPGSDREDVRRWKKWISRWFDGDIIELNSWAWGILPNLASISSLFFLDTLPSERHWKVEFKVLTIEWSVSSWSLEFAFAAEFILQIERWN